jgi:GNAT superfamily N-acetyltransferase
MFSVKNMSGEDVSFAVRLSNTMDWDLVKDDFEFMMELEPNGCFVLLHNSERAGIVTTVSFGKMGWFGNLIVSEEYREKGAGSLLASHAVNYLKNNNVETVGLYSYVDKIHFYERLGFTCDSYFTVMSGNGFSSPNNSNIREKRKTDIERIIDYDCSCLGVSRRKLLEPILLYQDNVCYVYVESEEIIGYIIAKVYRGVAEIGPLVCDEGRSDVAVSLLKAVLDRLDGLKVSMFVSEKQKVLLTTLESNGFVRSFRVARMFHGPPFVSDCVCMAESLERG